MYIENDNGQRQLHDLAIIPLQRSLLWYNNKKVQFFSVASFIESIVQCGKVYDIC